MTCNHKRYKIIKTHGSKSKGYLICKDCNKIIKKKDIKKWNKKKRR